MAAKSEFIRARVEPNVKARAERIMRKIGLRPSAAITLFYHQVIRHGGLPFQPNATTLSAMADIERGENLIEASTADELFDALESDDE